MYKLARNVETKNSIYVKIRYDADIGFNDQEDRLSWVDVETFGCDDTERRTT